MFRPMFRLTQETDRDLDEVEWLLDTAFAPGRTALSSYRLREGVSPVSDLCVIARDEFEAVAAAIRYWPVRIGKALDPALLLGPIAVHPTRQGEGLGGLLMNETLTQAAELGWSRVVLVGDEPYYQRFGFERRLAKKIRFPPPTNPARILARELVEGSMEGVSGTVRRWK
jgi:predicted N-acetyltransferase YhbS